MKGFNNLGNTCYLNSGLQMLIQNLDFCNIVRAFSSKNEVLSKITQIIDEYHKGEKTSISPSFIKDMLSNKNPNFVGFQQQDSSEFIVLLLDIINNEINKVCSKKNLLDKIFEIEITTSTKCKVLSCLNVSTNVEKSTILMLNLNSECNNLDDCYNLSKQKVKLEGDEKYFCEKCNKKRIASQRKEITKWPKNLIIWLRRYQQNGRRVSKYNQEIKVPIVWRYDYNLRGVVYHSGDLYGGHYVYAGKVNDKWYLFNDSNVSELHDTALVNIVNNGYIYYYDK